MSGYSRALEVQQKERKDNLTASDRIFAPKISYVSNILGQHLLHHDLKNTYSTFSNEHESGTNPNKKGSGTNHHLIKAEMLQVIIFWLTNQAFRRGDQQRFFDHRESLFDQLTYFKKDVPHALETEMKLRVYFALFYLTPSNTRSTNLEELYALTEPRLGSLKKYFAENGSKFARNERLKPYLQLPYIKLQRVDNKTFDYCISADFISELEEKIEAEFKSVIHFLSKDGQSSSFLMKMFEYYTNSHPKAQEMREQIQSAIINNMGELRSEKEDITLENFKLDEYQEKLASKFELLKKKFIQLGKQKDVKQEKLGLQIIPPVEFKAVSEK